MEEMKNITQEYAAIADRYGDSDWNEDIHNEPYYVALGIETASREIAREIRIRGEKRIMIMDRKLRELMNAPIGDDELPITEETYQSARKFLEIVQEEPLIGATPMGEIEMNWKNGDKKIVLRFLNGMVIGRSK